jgi:diguanylate cyclase (GGDEF)-like protein
VNAESNTPVYERAARGVRRLAQLAARSDDADLVRDTLVRELTVAIELERVTFAGRGAEDAAARDAAIRNAGTEAEQVGGVEEDRRRALVLELRSSAAVTEAVILVARAHRRLGAGEAIAAAALVEVAEVVLALGDARRQAAVDELTGCLSRRAGLTRLGEELERSRRTRSPVSCVMLDLDNLKQVNDTFGHLEGDRILRETGASLRRELRAYDLAARYGGDEFLVVLPAADHHAATYAAARMTAAIARITPPAHIPVSITFGAATSRPDERAEALLQRADRALLAAKRAPTRRANP